MASQSEPGSVLIIRIGPTVYLFGDTGFFLGLVICDNYLAIRDGNTLNKIILFDNI